MAVYTTYTAYAEYYTGAVSGCIGGGADYRTLGAKETIGDVNLLIDPKTSNLSKACEITNLKITCDYRVTNTSNGEGISIKAGFKCFPYGAIFDSKPSTALTLDTSSDGGVYPKAYSKQGLSSDYLVINSERMGNTVYWTHNLDVPISDLRFLNGVPFSLIGARFVLTSLNSVVKCRAWLRGVKFTITRKRACYVYFKDEGNNTLQTILCDYGASPTFTGTLPTKEGYSFDGWVHRSTDNKYTGTLPTAGETDVWYDISWKKSTYTLTVKAGTGGTVTGGGTYEHGSTATLTAKPNTGYKFVKWNDGNTSATRTITVTGGATYTATFEKIKVTATFKNHDGTVLQSVSVDYGNTPSYTGSTPTKSSTVEYTYTFSGWSPSLGAITSATTYTAQFTATKRKYAVTVNTGTGGTVSGGGTYEYGKSVTITATPNSRYKFVKWSDGNTSASRTITITGAATYTAYFEKLPPEFTSAGIIYSDKQVSNTNKVIANQGFVVSVGVI